MLLFVTTLPLTLGADLQHGADTGHQPGQALCVPGERYQARDILLTLYNMTRGESWPSHQPMRGLLGSLVANKRPRMRAQSEGVDYTRLPSLPRLQQSDVRKQPQS